MARPEGDPWRKAGTIYLKFQARSLSLNVEGKFLCYQLFGLHATAVRLENQVGGAECACSFRRYMVADCISCSRENILPLPRYPVSCPTRIPFNSPATCSKSLNLGDASTLGHIFQKIQYSAITLNFPRSWPHDRSTLASKPWKSTSLAR